MTQSSTPQGAVCTCLKDGSFYCNFPHPCRQCYNYHPGVSCYWHAHGKTPADKRTEGRTFPLSDGRLGCDECCNGDRCDDPTHRNRENCIYCLGSNNIEPVAEPASTGEPPLKECGQFTGRATDGSVSHCRKPRGHDGSCNPLHGIVFGAARPSEPSAPQTSAGPHRFGNECQEHWPANNPDCVKCQKFWEPFAPRPVAGEGPETRTCRPCRYGAHDQCNKPCACKDSAHLVSTEGTPKLEEIALPTAEGLARKAFLMQFGRDGFDQVEVKERDFILQWLHWGLLALRPFITPACFYCKFYGQEHCKKHATPASTGEANGWIAKAKDLLSEMQMFKDKQGFWLRAEQLLDAAPSSVPQEGPKKSPDSHLGAVRA